MVRFVLTFAVASAIIFTFTLPAQQSPPQSSPRERVFGSEDKDVVTPQPVLPLGRKDGAAIQLLSSFLTENGLSSLLGFQADAVFTDRLSSFPALLTIAPGNQCRLDVADSQAPRSIRIHGSLGTIQESDRSKHSLPSPAATTGLFGLFTVASHLANSATSVIDDGLIVINGETLHRVTFEMPASADQDTTSVDRLSVMDLYFDQNTHQLRKSATFGRLDSRDRAFYLQVTTYSDYRQANGAKIPHAFSQSLNGQLQWALQLTNVRFNPSVPDSYFRF